MTTLERPKTQALAGLVIGIFVLVMVTAILASAVTSAQVAGDLRHATGQLNDIRKADAKAEAARVASRARTQAQLASLQHHAMQQAAQDRAQRRYLAQLAKALRSHGIPVPSPPRVTVTAHPKGPGRSHPANPGHTAHGPRSPSTTSPTCLLAPGLCVPHVSVPTLLP